jgi:hypothetical protein
MIKCYACSIDPHRFRDCLSVTCGCSFCVQELYLIKNELLDDVAETSPRFLKIDNEEIKLLPDLTKEVTKFNHIKRHEWLPVKVDKRFKRRKQD